MLRDGSAFGIVMASADLRHVLRVSGRTLCQKARTPPTGPPSSVTAMPLGVEKNPAGTNLFQKHQPPKTSPTIPVSFLVSWFPSISQFPLRVGRVLKELFVTKVRGLLAKFDLYWALIAASVRQAGKKQDIQHVALPLG